MAGEISLDIVSDSRSAVRGVKDVGKALDDVVDDIDKVADEGTDAERDLTKAFREVARNARKSGDDVGDSFKGMGEGTQAFKDEAIQNFSEVASSFKGDVGDMADGIQGLTGGLASALTPGVGIPLAILGATAAAFLQSWQENAEATEERVSSMYDDMLESGERYLSASFIAEGIQEIVRDQGRYNDAAQKAKDLDVERGDVLRAMAGDQNAISSILDQTNAKRQAEVDAVKDAGGSLDDQAIKMDAINAKYGTQLEWLYDVIRETDSAVNRFDAAQSATSDYFRGLINSADEASVEIDALGNKVYELPDGTEIFVDAETGEATLDLDRFQGDLDGIKDKDVKVNARVSNIDDSPIRNYRPPTIYFPGRVVLPNGRQAV